MFRARQYDYCHKKKERNKRVKNKILAVFDSDLFDSFIIARECGAWLGAHRAFSVLCFSLIWHRGIRPHECHRTPPELQRSSTVLKLSMAGRKCSEQDLTLCCCYQLHTHTVGKYLKNTRTYSWPQKSQTCFSVFLLWATCTSEICVKFDWPKKHLVSFSGNKEMKYKEGTKSILSLFIHPCNSKSVKYI